MAEFQKLYSFTQNLGDGVYDFSSDTLKIALSNTAPLPTDSVLADIAQISTGSGYVSGGNVSTVISSTQTFGVLRLILANTVFTASTGSIGPFQYAVLYDDTPSSPLKPLIGWFDAGSAITMISGQTFTVIYDGSNGVLIIS